MQAQARNLSHTEAATGAGTSKKPVSYRGSHWCRHKQETCLIQRQPLVQAQATNLSHTRTLRVEYDEQYSIRTQI
jgi:hypothetical protein